jgi:hypothetical protein
MPALWWGIVVEGTIRPRLNPSKYACRNEKDEIALRCFEERRGGHQSGGGSARCGVMFPENCGVDVEERWGVEEIVFKN